MTFDRDQAHALIERAISHIREGGVRVGPKMHDALYRMACVGIMTVYEQRNENIPTVVLTSIMSGRKLSDKTWQEVLGE